MRKTLVVVFLLLASPSFAWYDAYGGFTCGYMDPLTSVLDNIFGPPCPPPVAVVQQQQTIIQQQTIQSAPNDSWFSWW